MYEKEKDVAYERTSERAYEENGLKTKKGSVIEFKS